ncbi:radical SAM protein [Azotosporobacter soli]|uniref:radical SAM protein n=1 Tax=Azotosporobacter soli TaxID=3055040 RepID=UPI0031FE737D
MERIGEVDEISSLGWQVRQANFSPVITFATPKRTKTISVTGSECALNCAHCGGHYLQAMQPLTELHEPADLQADSCLISGGCSKQGRVPIAQHATKLTALKQGRRYNIHTGLIDEKEIGTISRLADAVSFDFVGDDLTICEVLGLQHRVEDYVQCYSRLKNSVRVVPHICIGLHGGAIRGEYRALQLLQEMGVEALTFIVFLPTKGTKYEKHMPPPLEETIQLLARARLQFPTTPIHLGCMRPGGRYRSELDEWAVRLGVNTIVNPAPAARTAAQELGLEIRCKEECCVL